jgi:triosephosphate isomerase
MVPGLVVGNWKMHGDKRANEALLRELKQASGAQRKMAVCVPFPYLAQTQALLQGSPITWGSQDVSEHSQGAFTGAVSAAMVADFGCRYTLVGHSERRSLYAESDALVVLKAKAALGAGLVPIVCVGETLAEREAGQTDKVVLRQLEAVIAGLDEGVEGIVVAYEPVWAIGTGRTASPEQAQEVHALIRKRLERAVADPQAMPLLYGGSVKADNAKSLFAMPDIDGGLVGGASLKAAEFLAIAAA